MPGSEPDTDADSYLAHVDVVTGHQQRRQRIGGQDPLVTIPEVQRHRAPGERDTSTGAEHRLGPVEESQRMTNALMRAGCKDVKLTVYPQAGHDSWTEAYNTPELYDWFLAHKRAK